MKKFIIINLILFTIVLNLFNTTYASVTITEENLESSLGEIKEIFKNEVTGEESADITVDKTNNKIKIPIEGHTYSVSYTVSEQPTFSIEIPIQKGISYEDFKTETENLLLPMIGYAAIANLNGIKAEDSLGYFSTSYLKSALSSGLSSSSNSYVIVEDSNGTNTKSSDNNKVIYTSEFGDRVMEYVNHMYKDKQTISDSDSLNSYSLIVEKKDTTETSCTLRSTLKVNPNANFSELNGYVDSLADSFLGQEITKENADFSLELKVGQKCVIESENEITGHATSGGCVEINDEKTEMIATKAGIAKGYFSIGDVKKTFYITVDESTSSEPLSTKVIKIEKVITTTTEEVIKQNILSNNNFISSQTKLPQTGNSFELKDGLYTLCIASAIILLFIVYKSVKYRNTQK